MRIAVFGACLHVLHPLEVGALSSPSRASVSPTTPEAGSPLVIRVVVELDPAYDEEVGVAVRSVVVDAAAGAGHVVADGDSAKVARLDVSLRWFDEADGDIRVEYVVMDDRVDDGSVPSTVVHRCDACDATMLVESVRAQIGEVLAAFDRPVGPPPVVHPTVPPPQRGDGHRRPLSRVGWAGVGLSIAATAPLASGLALFLRGEVPGEPTTHDERLLDATDYRPPGLALLGAAAGVLATGVTLVIVDRVRARRAARRHGTAHAARNTSVGAVERGPR